MKTKELGERIAFLRNNLGMSQEDLALKAKVARGALQALEKGRSNPTLSTVAAIEDALGQPIIQLQSTSTANEWAKVFLALATEGPVRVNASLFLLTKDEMYLERLRDLGLGPVAQSLQKLQKAL